MAVQLRKKFIKDDAIDGSKIKLLHGQTIRTTDSSGNEVDLLKVDANGNAVVSGVEQASKAALDQEIVDRQSGDASTLSSAQAYADQKVADLVNSAPEVLDTLKELSDALGGDSNFATTVAGQIGSVDSKIDQEILDRQSGESSLQSSIDLIDGRVSSLESEKEIVKIDSLGVAPSLGLEDKVYLTKDDNKLYHWATAGGGSLSFDKVVGSGEEFATLQDALASAVDGENILVKAGTYLVSSTIAVNKQVKIVGEDKASVIFETAAATSAPVSMFNVSVDNVALAKMTIKHKKTSNTSVETAVVASGGGFPQTRIANFIMEDCVIEYAEFGLTVRAESWCVRGTTFTYATGSLSNSNRAIGIYGTKGNSFIKDVFLKNDVLNGTSFRPLYMTSTTGSNPNETVSGKLVIEGTTHVGPLSQFFNQDNQQSEGAGSFELQIKNNIINEANLFAAFYSASPNAGDMFSSVTLSGNSISNLHAVDGGKGLYGVAGTAAFRSSPLVVHASNNTLGQEVYRTGWMAVEGSTVGKETAVPEFSVALDSSIPESGEAPSALAVGASGQYIELAPQADLSGIESDISSLQNQVDSIVSTYATDSELAAATSSLMDADTALDQKIDGNYAIYETEVGLLRSDIDSNTSSIAQEILDRQSAITSTESLISNETSARENADLALSDRLDPMEEILEFEKAIVYNDNAPVYADAKQGAEDEALRSGWYFKNTIAGEKINWYFFDGANQADVSLGDFSAYAVMTFDSVSPVRSPILAVYTMPTGTNDVAPGFAHSRMVYSGLSITPVSGKKYLVYFGQNPAIHPELPRIELAMMPSLSVGEKLPTERVLTSSFGSDSGALVNTVQFMVESLGINSPSFKAEAELKIKAASLPKLDALSSRVQTLENAEPAQIVYVEDEQHTMSSAELSFVDLDFEASAIMKITNGRVNLFKGYDYTVSVVSGKARLTFIGPSAQGGAEAVEDGDIISASYIKA